MYHVWCLAIQDLSSKFIYCICIHAYLTSDDNELVKKFSVCIFILIPKIFSVCIRMKIQTENFFGILISTRLLKKYITFLRQWLKQNKKWSSCHQRFIWYLDLQLLMQSLSITTNVSSNPSDTRCTQHYVIKFVSDLRQQQVNLVEIRIPKKFSVCTP
jgi:hypothetical protein